MSFSSKQVEVNKSYEVECFEAAWEGALLPWIEELSTKIKFTNKLSAIVAPHASTLTFIKEQLLRAGFSLVGIEFWTAGNARSYLLRAHQQEKTVALREDLHMVMRSTALSLPQNPLSAAICLQPEMLVKACDTLCQAGHSAEAFKDFPFLYELALAYFERLEKNSIATAQYMDHVLRGKAPFTEPCLGHTFLYAFSARHWYAFPLLQSLVAASENITACLWTENIQSFSIEAWVGFWESHFGGFEKLEPRKARTFFPLAASFEYPDFPEPVGENIPFPQFLLAQSPQEEAEAITANLLKLLANEGETLRIGIVLPSQNVPLARMLAQLLDRLKIAYQDHIGHLLPPTAPQRLFLAWAAWQAEPNLDSFALFTETLLECALIEAPLYLEVKKLQKKAFLELFSKDYTLFLVYIEETQPASSPLHAFLNFWKLLPAQSTLGEFMELAEPYLDYLKWPQEASLLKARCKPLERFTHSVLRENFIDWLKGITQPLGRATSSYGNCPYAKVHLLTVEEAYAESWTHLFLADMSHANWASQPNELPFLKTPLVKALNRSILRQGVQGEGHLSLNPRFAFINTTEDVALFAQSAFVSLLRSTSKHLTLSVHLYDPSEPSTPIQIAHFYEQLHYLVEGELLTDALQNNLREYTACQANQIHACLNLEPTPLPDLDALKTAFLKRRDPSTPFDSYSFCFKTIPKNFYLGAKAWEEALTNPVAAWFKHILYLEPALDDISFDNCHALAVGSWTHEWIGKPFSYQTHFAPALEQKAWLNSILDEAHKKYIKTEALFKKAGKELPHLWVNSWEAALQKSHLLTRALLQTPSLKTVLSEYTLPPTTRVTVKDLLDLPLSGRVDMVVTDSARPNFDASCLVVDFKTGNQPALSLKRLQKGEGLQLALYALALFSQGYKNISCAYLSANSLDSVPLPIQDLLSLETLWKKLQFIAQTGTFGLNGPIRDAYQNSVSFPLASLNVAPEVLQAKQRQTFTFS